MPTPGGPAGAAPTGAPGAVPAGGQPAAGAAAPQGIRVSPGDPKFPTREQFLNRQRLDGKPLTDAMKAWDDLRKQNEEVRDVGTLNRATGMFYPNPNVSEVDRKIGQSTYTVPAGLAFRLDAAQMSGNADEYQRLANEFLSGKVSGAPPRSKQQSELEQEEAKTFAVESAKKAVEQESKLETQYDSARRLNSSATRLIDLVSKNPRGFGQFMTPDLMGAIGTLLTSTVRAGGTTIGLGDVEDTVRKLSANMTKADLNAVSLALSELANIELAYTQMDLGKQGAITEGERAIVRRLGGSISDSPEVLLQKALLVKNNAEFNIKLTRKFYEMQEADPKLTVSKFRRSKEYRQMEEEHDRNVSTMFAPRASVSPAAPGAAPARPAGAGPAPTAPARPSTGAPAATSRPPGAATPQGSGATPMYPGATGRLNDMGFGIGSGR